MPKKYIDSCGWKYQVMSGLGENSFKARYQRPEKHGDVGWKGLAACEAWGLTFDAVNESLPDWVEAHRSDPRKVGASEYWDDRAVRLPAAPPVPECFQGVELIDKNAVLQRLVKYGWLKMNALEDSAEMIAVQSILYDAPTITLSSDAPLTWV